MIERHEVEVGGVPTYVWTGGQGDPLLLLHGAWGGAQMHWEGVWEELAKECRVLAPEFPGLAHEAPRVPASMEAAAEWAEGVLDACRAPAAWVAGNSFGAAVAARLASRSPARCRGLILVDGGPPPHIPAALGSLLRLGPVRPGVERLLERGAYSPATLGRAFADPGRAPAALREVLDRRRPPQLRVTSEIFLAGDPPAPPPRVRTLIVWGADDRLPGGTTKAARRLAGSLADARLEVIPDAGHLPQVEQPERFLRAVLAFVHGEG
jgi:2-hydroxy-6-oxonona-2,4-dienedioate hydrolase